MHNLTIFNIERIYALIAGSLLKMKDKKMVAERI
jgi:hypothetical protein